jgi:hypothetical protein
MTKIMTTSELAIPYIYPMNTANWQKNFTAPIGIKILAVIAALATAFFVFHTAMMFAYDEEITRGTFYIAAWTQEIYFNIWVAAPVVLFLIGKSMQSKQSKLLIVFTALFAVCYLLNIGNTYEWIDIPHLQFPMSAALLGILITWIITVIKRKKTVLDALKFLWLFGFVYSFIVPRFVPGGHEAGNFLLGSMFVFPFMMTLGLLQFYRRFNTSPDAT